LANLLCIEVFIKIGKFLSLIESTITVKIRMWQSFKFRYLKMPLFLLLMASLCICVVPESSAKQSYTVKPPPFWVQNTPLPQEELAKNDSQSSVIYLLLENQIHVTTSRTERYHRRVQKVLTTSGLDDVSQLEFNFEPSYQELQIHHIRILRGGETIEALKPKEIKVIQQEKELDQQLYNGTFSAITFLSDVRQGDIIDYAYSINGENPVMRGRFSSSFPVDLNQPVEKLRWRLLYPGSRSLYIQNHRTDIRPVTRTLGNETEYIWERNNVEAIEVEDYTPAWFDAYPYVQLSEFASWEDVVNWAAPLYQIKQPLSPKLQQQINKWRAESPQAEQQLISALRFTQDEVRYLGVELDVYSHQPNQPSAVFERRFGDCKDKSLLLVSMLNSLGIEAYPALVHTSEQHELDEWQPTPYAFDHCIVQAKLNDKTYWLDPTISYQRGELAIYQNPNYERALVVREGSKALEKIQTPTLDKPAIEVKQVYQVPDDDSFATLLIDTTYRGEAADSTRYRIAEQSLAELGKSYLNYYAEQDHSIKAAGQPVIVDDPQTNTLKISEKYTITEFWNNGERSFYADQIYSSLSNPRTVKRAMPIAVSHPVYVSESIEVHLPRAFSIENTSGTLADGSISFDYRYTTQGKVMKMDFKLQSLRDFVPPDQTEKYIKTVEKIKTYAGYTISRDASGRFDARGTEKGVSGFFTAFVWALFIGPFVIFGTLFGLRRMREKKRLNGFKQKYHSVPGAEPANAIRLNTQEEMFWQVSNFRSACGSPFYKQGAQLQSENMSFDGQRLTVIALQCEVCGETRDVYFAQINSSINQ
jgi:transglutaminase-like putative cysteine protease